MKYREIQEARKLADSLLKKLQTAEKATAEIEQNLEDAVLNCQIDQIEEILQTTDIEKIASVTPGLRISLLKEHDIHTLNDLYHTSEKTLTDISGIGPETAGKLMNSLKYIVSSISASIPVRLHADEPDRKELQLMKAVHRRIKSEKDAETGRLLYEGYAEGLREDRSTLGKVSTALRWFFSRTKTKAELETAAESVRQTDVILTQELDRLLMRLRKETDLSDEEALNHFRKNSPAYYAVLDAFHPDPGIESIPDRIADEVNSLDLQTEHLHAVLRRYQEFGAKYIVVRKHVLLADEMGLGKTVEAIAAAVHLHNTGGTHFLTVCPLGIIAGWQKEIERFSDFKPYLIRSNPEKQLSEWQKNGGFAVTSYETLNRLTLPEDLKIDLLVVDEAHYVKNPKAKRTQSVLRFAAKAERVLYMTGTPLENRPEELCYLISCLSPQTAEEIEDILFLHEAELFRQKIAPVYLRRRREDVLRELPEISRFDSWLDMTESEIAAYLKTVEEGNFMAMRQVSWNAPESMKAARLLELCEQAKQAGRKTVIFSQFLNTISFVYDMLKDECPVPITGSVPPEKRLEIIENFSEDPEQHFLILQVQSGGIGQNIQAASVVIFCEPQLKPSAENQALSRVYRMGQLNHVFCYRLLSAGSIDERIIELLDEKQAAFDLYADESAAAESESSAFHMKDLIEEERKKWNITRKEPDPKSTAQT